jgi:hypothetical protein
VSNKFAPTKKERRRKYSVMMKLNKKTLTIFLVIISLMIGCFIYGNSFSSSWSFSKNHHHLSICEITKVFNNYYYLMLLQDIVEAIDKNDLDSARQLLSNTYRINPFYSGSEGYEECTDEFLSDSMKKQLCLKIAIHRKQYSQIYYPKGKYFIENNGAKKNDSTLQEFLKLQNIESDK